MCFRLTSQLTRLAVCLTAVTQRPRCDETVLARVRKVALDTARGRTYDVARHLAAKGRAGVDLRGMLNLVHEEEQALVGLLKFLRKIKVVERFQSVPPGGRVAGRVMYRLTDRFARLWAAVVEGG